MSTVIASDLPRAGRIGIIGAGAVGLSCAIHLQRAGYEVEIFDPREPGEGASLGNAGIIAVSEVLPLGRPSTLRQLPPMLFDPTGPLVIRWSYLPTIAPWLMRYLSACRPTEVHRISAALTSLLIDAVDAWREIVRGSAAEGRLLASGWLRVYQSKHDLRRTMGDVARQRDHGVRVEILDGGQIRDLEPALAPAFAGAAFYPDVCHVNSPLLMMRALASLIVRAGGSIRKREVQRIDIENVRPVIVDSSGHRSDYDRIIVAAGAWSRQIVRTLGIDVPLDTERGYHVMLPTPLCSLRHPVSVAVPGYSLVPMEDGIRLTSGVEFAGLDAPPDFRRIRRMAKHAATILLGLDALPISEWLGFRPSMPRSLPVIGPVDGHPNVILAFGHGHLGLTLGPITGRLVAALVEGRPLAVDITPFLHVRHS